MSTCALGNSQDVDVQVGVQVSVQVGVQVKCAGHTMSPTAPGYQAGRGDIFSPTGDGMAHL